MLVPLAQGGVEEVRRISRHLKPLVLDDLGMLAAISWLCRDFETIYDGIHIQSQIEIIEESDVPDSLKTVIFRVLQEALNNIGKHSQAHLVHICLGAKQDRIELAVDDNGVGFEVEGVVSEERAERGLGIASMKERTWFSGGSFSVESVPGKGTTVRAQWLR
jgi:signal transduction histidine kinase